MKNVIFLHGDFKNANDIHKLISGLAMSYIYNKLFIMCEYKEFTGTSIKVENPILYKVDKEFWVSGLETCIEDTLEENIEVSVVDLFIVTGFKDYENNALATHIEKKLEAKSLNFIFYDKDTRAKVIGENKYATSLKEIIRTEHLNRVSQNAVGLFLK